MRKTQILASLAVLVLGTIFLRGQDDSLSTMKQTLTSDYTLTTTTADKTGIVTPGSVLLLKQSDLVAGKVSSVGSLGNTYKGGKITHSLMGKMASGTPDSRTFVAGEKIWVTNIDVTSKGITFTLFSDAYSDAHFQASLLFPFPKGASPSASDAERMVAEVFDVEGGRKQSPAASARQAVNNQAPAAGTPPAATSASDNTPWNPKYGRLTAQDMQRMNLPFVRFDVNYLRLNPAALNQKQVMQYFIALNNCNNSDIPRAIGNELDYPALAAYYQSKATQILAALPNTVTDVALYRYIGGQQADGWRLWSKSLTLGEYNTQRKAFPLKYPGKDDVEIASSLSISGGRDLSNVCPATRAASGASAYLPSTYTIQMQPAVYKELPMDEDAARKYIDSAGQQRAVFLAMDVNIQDSPPVITHPSNGNTEATFRVQTSRIRVIDAKNMKPLGTLYDDHSLPAEVQVAQTPPPSPAPSKPGSQWAASDHLYDVRQAVYISLAADACGWPLTTEQSSNLKSFLEKVKNGKYNEKEQYYTTDTVVRNAIARQGRTNYCANAAERRDFDKAAANVAPLGPIAAP